MIDHLDALPCVHGKQPVIGTEWYSQCSPQDLTAEGHSKFNDIGFTSD